MQFDQLKRREFITLLSVASLWPLVVRAQQPDRIRLIGVLMGFAENDPTAQSMVAAFRAALAKLGWTEGSNVRIELRWSGYDRDRIKTLAKELARRDPWSDHTCDCCPRSRDTGYFDRIRDGI